MALYLYDAEDVRLSDRICSLDDTELKLLEPCISELHSKTGIILDSYGTKRLRQNQIDMLNQCLLNRQSLNQKKHKGDTPAMAIFKKLNSFKNGLIAFGD